MLERRNSPQGAGSVDDSHAFLHRVSEGAPAIGGGQVQAVRNRSAPIVGALERGQSAPNAQQAAQVSGVAVGVEARGVDDGHGQIEVARAVEQRQDDESDVGHHMAVAAVLNLTIALGYHRSSVPPVGSFLV